jgi:hypothetical protein
MKRSSNLKQVGSFFVGSYGWLITIFFGMILVDILYSKRVPASASASSNISDLLLMVGCVVLISAVLALGFAWNRPARNLLIASLCLILLEFIIPAFLSPFLQDPSGLAIGPWLRVIPSGAASILALIGIYCYDR